MTTEHKRRGNTGIWTFVMEKEGMVLAESPWCTNYAFCKAQWEALPIVTEPDAQC
jgi:hypothetical protein